MAENHEQAVDEVAEGADAADGAADEAAAEDTAQTAPEDTEAAETAEDTAESNNVSDDPDDPETEIEALKKELADEKERYLRLDAEYYNYRTRSLKEKQDAYDNALIKTVTEVLGVIDNFERAMASECSDESFKKGVEMIFRQYLAILEKLGVTEIEAEGKTFDPNLHNAVSRVEDETLGENTVAAVLQKGYCLGKKVIRHAMVTVANP